MHYPNSLAVLSAAPLLASATNLFVSSYAGTITTLSLAAQNTTSRSHTYALTSIYSNTGCSPSPSWLTLDPTSQILYCLDEGLTTPNGSLSSYSIAPSGNLTQIEKQATISGPVSGVIYGNPAGERAIALAHYTGSSVSSWTLSSSAPGNFSFLQSETFTLAQPGPDASRQDAPHEHEALLDPLGKFILVPDLGADLVRVFAINASTDKLEPQTPLKVTPGSGPRHGAFWRPRAWDAYRGGFNATNSTTTKGPLFFYLVTELGNTVTGYSVSYPKTGGMAFEQVYESSVYGNLTLPVGNAAAEIAVSPDNTHLTISSRNNTSFHLPNPDKSNSTLIPSDSLSTFAIHTNGSLTFTQLWPAGGLFPRQFAFSKRGDLIAVGLQESSEVVVMSVDRKSGKIGKPLARAAVEGQVTCVVWDE